MKNHIYIYQSIVFHPATSLFSMEVLRWLTQSRDITQRFTIHHSGIEKMDGRLFLKDMLVYTSTLRTVFQINLFKKKTGIVRDQSTPPIFPITKCS